MNRARKALAAAALLSSLTAGGVIGASVIGVAGAQDSSSTTQPAAQAPAATAQAPADNLQPPTGQPGGPRGDHAGQPGDPSQGGHVGQNGVKEELLTGDTAAKVTAAAQAAVPGGTVQRVETDAEGDVYEAHMLDASGKPVTVKLDANFSVTKTEQGGPR